MEKNDEEYYSQLNNKRTITIPDIYLEEFQNSITENRINNLYTKLKSYESKGYVSHDKYMQSMKETFNEPMVEQIVKKQIENFDLNCSIMDIEEIINELYELYFLRFREVKLIIKNDKKVFYLTDYKLENFINSYNVVCSITIFLKSCFENKIKLLYNLTDIDEDGFLNESEIKLMITTCNFLFCEETNLVNTNSTILAQSLTNYKVNEILKEILYDPGNLYMVLEEEKYIYFELLYQSIKLVKDYKYRIIPCYINLKQCLSNIRKEKIIQINDKHKFDFIKVSSFLFCNRTGASRIIKNQKNFSSSYLNTIIKPKKMTDYNNKTKFDLPIINKSFCGKRSNKNLTNFNKKKLFEKTTKLNISENNHQINKNKSKSKLLLEKSKSLKDLLRETTIIEMKDEKKNENSKNFTKNLYFNKDKKDIKYYFEVYLDKIRNIEVEPGLLKFINNDNYNNNNNITTNSNISTHNANSIFRQTNEYKRKHSEKNVNFGFNKEKNFENLNYVVQEEKSNEDLDNRAKISKEAKKTKKIKMSNISTINETNKNLSPISPRIINYGMLNKSSNNNKHQNKSSLRKKIFNLNKSSLSPQKNTINSNIEGNRYKTLEDIFDEMKRQENKFNSDSYGGFLASFLNIYDKILKERNEIKKLLGDSDKKDISLAFYINFLNKVRKKKKQI